MRQRFSLIGSNPLLQRVRRITSMPTLYRAPDPAAGDLPLGRPVAPSTPAAAASSPVVATLYRSLDSTQPQMQESPPLAREFGRAPLPPAMSPPAQPASPPSPSAKAPPATVQASPSAQPRPPAAPATPEAEPQQPAQAGQPDQPGQPPASPDDDWDWIDDRQWDNLKSFMARHQQVEAEEQARQAEIQRSPEEIQRAEEKKQAEAELSRRQELARSGQLPRAQVVYLSPEEKAAGTAPMPELPAGPVAGPPAAEPIAAKTEVAPAEETAPPSEAPSSETAMRNSAPPALTPSTAPPPTVSPPAAPPPTVSPPAAPPAPKTATETASERSSETPEQPAEVERMPETAPGTRREPAVTTVAAEAPQSPDVPLTETQPETAPEAAGLPVQARHDPAAPESVAAVQATPTEQSEPAATGVTPNVGRRLLKAARSLFRRADEDETVSATEETGAEAAVDDLPVLSQVVDGGLPPVATEPPGLAAAGEIEAGPALAPEAATIVP